MDKKEILNKLLTEYLKKGKPVLIVGLNNPEIPTIHNFYPRKYYESIVHLGFGLFEGQTEHGYFHFDGGGAMNHHQFEDNTWLSWTSLRTQNAEVLKDLRYDFEKVINILKQIITTL